MHRPLRLAALVLGATLLAACSGEDASTSSAGGASADRAQADGSAGASAAASAGGSAEGLAVPGAAPVQQTGTALARVDPAGSAVIRTAELGVRVDDVRASADAAGRLVRDAGGSVAAERADATSGSDVANAELSLRVPPERFDEVLARLSDLGEERSRSLGTEEVGDELVDLDSRLATQRASVERVRALLAEATNLGEVVQIEAELTRRTADLESLQARRAALGEQVEMSTIVLRLDSEDDEVIAGGPGFFDGLRTGWEALVATAVVLATVTGAVLPFVPLVLVATWVVLRLRRRRADAGPAAVPVTGG